MKARWRRLLDALGNVTGRRFGLVVASSLMTTSVVVAAALTAGSGQGALAALLNGLSLPAGATTTDAATSRSAGGPPSFTPAKAPAPARTVRRTVATGQAAPAPTPAPAAPAATTTTSTPDPAPAPIPPPHAGRIKHVFVITLSSPGYDQTFGTDSQMPYLATTLVPEGELLSGYSLLTTAGLPNYIAMVSGQPPNPMTKQDCPKYKEFPSNAKFDGHGRLQGSGCVYSNDTLTVADQLQSGGFTWHAYMQDMADDTGPHNCVHPDSGAADRPPKGGYAARQNPFVYFHSLLDLGACAINDVPLDGLDTDLEKVATTPNYSFISPNLCDAGVVGQCPDGGPDGAASADGFLSQLVPKILDSPAYKRDGLLIVTFGETQATAPASATRRDSADAADPKQVGAVLLSPYITPGESQSTSYDPNSILRSTEDLFGLTALANAGVRNTESFAGPLLGGD